MDGTLPASRYVQWSVERVIHIRNGEEPWCKASTSGLAVIEQAAVASLPDSLRAWVCRTCLARTSGRATLYVCQYCDAGLGLYSAMSHVLRCEERPMSLTCATSPLPLVIRIRVSARTLVCDRVRVECHEIQGIT